MDQQSIIAGLEDRARGVGLSMSEICRRAKVHPTTFSRWKLSERNPQPIGATIKCLNALQMVIEAAEREHASSDTPPSQAPASGKSLAFAGDAVPLSDRMIREEAMRVRSMGALQHR
jgi:hypothetical protein